LTAPPSLAAAPWLAAAETRRLFAALVRDGDEARVVGGAVRDALLGLPVTGDLDVATTAAPDVVTARATAAGLKVVPTGIEHGTVTVIVDGRPFEVTTLRHDVETDGRRAKVAFGSDWAADARRRDFTINALSVDPDGTVHDPVGGYADVLARRVRFIGDAQARIREDYLRILRFFRFHARFGGGEPDRAGLVAAMRLRAGLARLSAERVAAEMRRLLVAPGAAATVATMSDTGLLQPVLGGVALIGRFARFTALAAGHAPAAPALVLAALAARLPEDVDRLAARLKLAKAERARMAAAVDAAADIARGDASPAADRRRAWRHGREGARDGLLIAWAEAGEAADAGAWTGRLALVEGFAPRFPVAGRDLTARGVAPGPELGRILAALEARWIASDFRLDRAALLAETPMPTAPPTP